MLCPAAHGSCLSKRIKKVTWLSKRISDWQLSRALASVVLDTAVKPEIFKFLQHVVFSSQLGFKGELFLILSEQGSWLLRAWPGPFLPLLKQNRRPGNIQISTEQLTGSPVQSTEGGNPSDACLLGSGDFCPSVFLNPKKKKIQEFDRYCENVSGWWLYFILRT